MSRTSKAAPRAPAEPALAPVDEVVATLARLLAEARAGTLKAVAVACVRDAKPFIGSTSGVAQGDLLSIQLLTAAIHDLMHEWQHAKRGR